MDPTYYAKCTQCETILKVVELPGVELKCECEEFCLQVIQLNPVETPRGIKIGYADNQEE